MTGVLIAAVAIGVPVLAFTLWPLVRRSAGRPLLAFPPDPREQLTEQKRTVLRALQDLEFEHAAGHVSDDDYAGLRARYESEAAELIAEIDRLVAADAAAPRGTVARRGAEATGMSVDADRHGARLSAWTRPGALATAGVVLLAFGIAIGVGIVRYTEPDPNAGQPMPGSRPLATLDPPSTASDGTRTPGAGSPPQDSAGGTGTLPPAMLQGMLQAARQALFSGQYSDAIAAYKAILKRDPNNVDAMTHMGLIAAIASHTDDALRVFDRVLELDPKYAPALLYKGQVLYDKGDAPGAIASWESFLKVAPAGDDRQRVEQLIAEAKRAPGKPPAR